MRVCAELVLLPLLAVGALIAMALGPFLAGPILAFAIAVYALVWSAAKVTRGINHWRLEHHWHIGHAHVSRHAG